MSAGNWKYLEDGGLTTADFRGIDEQELTLAKPIRKLINDGVTPIVVGLVRLKVYHRPGPGLPTMYVDPKVEII